MTITEAIKKRQSVRTYVPDELNPKALKSIKALISENASSIRFCPFGTKPRLQLIDLSSMPEEERGKLGTYGFIRGAKYFIAGITEIPQTADSGGSTTQASGAGPAGIMTDFGFAFEGIILELTRLGLGTCWLGGTFKRQDLSEMLELGSNEIIPAISPVGYAAERQSLKSRFIRFAAGSKNRKPLDELIFPADSGTGTELEADPEADPKVSTLKEVWESVRLAPSASNKQPWRIVTGGFGKTTGTYHFFIQRNKGYGMFGEYIDLQRVDSGIALRHFAETSKELGIAGTWTEDYRPAANSLPEAGQEWEYVISWKGE